MSLMAKPYDRARTGTVLFRVPVQATYPTYATDGQKSGAHPATAVGEPFAQLRSVAGRAPSRR
ncbi:hypothetical protein GCM10009780_46060 [Actinomadura alba]